MKKVIFHIYYLHYRELDDKRAPFVFFTFAAYASVLLFGDGFDYGEAETGTGLEAGGTGTGNRVGAFENVGKGFGRNSDTVVGNGNDSFVTLNAGGKGYGRAFS